MCTNTHTHTNTHTLHNQPNKQTKKHSTTKEKQILFEDYHNHGPFSHPAFVTSVVEGAVLGTRDPRCLTPSDSLEEDMDDCETFV